MPYLDTISSREASIENRKVEMKYTVKQLAQLSGVSIRTLHWYDEIGLLKPGCYGANGYRYYEEKQLMLLQHILFFRELGFSLDDIKKLLLTNDFDQVRALYAHKRVLEEDIARKQKLITTVEKTILYQKGKQTMSDKELYYGFDSTRQKEYEQYIVKYQGLTAEDLLIESKKRTAKWDKDEWDMVKNEGDAIHKALAVAIDKGLSPESDEVQVIIQRHYRMVNSFYDATQELYIGLTQLYSEHPDFKKFFDVYHPKMIEFIGKAMKFYAHKNLK
jgi:DNA-binding transcriptional MerR regulator